MERPFGEDFREMGDAVVGVGSRDSQLNKLKSNAFKSLSKTKVMFLRFKNGTTLRRLCVTTIDNMIFKNYRKPLREN